jgi:NADH-quinone oxidoreductase subunit L
LINLVWLIPLLPGLAFAVIGLFTRRSRSVSTFLSLGAMGVATALAYGTFFELLGGARTVDVRLPWINLGDRLFTVGWQVDPLTAIMLVVVTSVALLVQIYSIGYMADDPGYPRFFSYLSLFGAAMLGLVLANNLLTIYIFWEGVGLGSYLLIGFWYANRSATEEARPGVAHSTA